MDGERWGSDVMTDRVYWADQYPVAKEDTQRGPLWFPPSFAALSRSLDMMKNDNGKMGGAVL